MYCLRTCEKNIHMSYKVSVDKVCTIRFMRSDPFEKIAHQMELECITSEIMLHRCELKCMSVFRKVLNIIKTG